MRRREWLQGVGAAAAGLALGHLPKGWTAEGGRKRQALMFTKCSGFIHPVVGRKGDELAFAEKILKDLGPEHGFEVTVSKDGRLFTPEGLAKFDVLVFYTSGDLTKAGSDKQPPMPPEGKKVLLDAIAKGKGFVGIHSATDSFRTGKGQIDPYIAMVGGEFSGHGPQQKAKLTVADKSFPGVQGLGDGIELHEEWYTHYKFASDLHVILIQETAGMTHKLYQRPPFPATWARMHGKGRVFYTALGHREDIWTNPRFQEILIGGMRWAAGDIKADVAPNIKKVTPGYEKMPS